MTTVTSIKWCGQVREHFVDAVRREIGALRADVEVDAITERRNRTQQRARDDP